MRYVVVGVLVVVAVALVWRGVSRSHDRSAASPTSPVATIVPSSPASREEQPSRPPSRKVTRVSPEQRRALRTQIEHARIAQSAARTPALPDAASDDNAMETAEQVLQQVMAVLDDVRPQVADCRHYAPDAKGFTTKISLIGDPDIGTVIDAPAALVPVDGPPFPKAFDECVRDVLQTLELPPMRTGDQFAVTFNMGFTDEDSESPDRP